MWSSSVRIFHALTWWRKTATAAAEWRFPWLAWVRRRRGRGGEALPHRRWWSSGARVWGARAREKPSSGVNEVRKGRGVFIDTVKNCSPEDLGRTCPWPFSFTWHVSPTYWKVEIVLDRGWIDNSIVGYRTIWAAKPKIWIRLVLKFRSQFLQLTRTQWRFWTGFK